MKSPRFVFLVGVLIAFMFAGAQAAAPPQGEASTRTELMQKLGAMQAEIDRLEAEIGRQSQQSKVEQTAAIEQVLRDADRRSRLVMTDGGLLGGWDSQKKGFYLGSEDGNFYFHPTA